MFLSLGSVEINMLAEGVEMNIESVSPHSTKHSHEGKRLCKTNMTIWLTPITSIHLCYFVGCKEYTMLVTPGLDHC